MQLTKRKCLRVSQLLKMRPLHSPSLGKKLVCKLTQPFNDLSELVAVAVFDAHYKVSILKNHVAAWLKSKSINAD